MNRGKSPLAPAESATLAAVLERMFPADERDPGAIGLGAVRYVEDQLAGELNVHLADYRWGLAWVDRLAQERCGARFAALEPQLQDEVLAVFDRDESSDPDGPDGAPSGRAFVDLLDEHLYEGLLGDPRYGGNRDGCGWDLIRFPGPRRTVDPADQELDATPRKGLPSTYEDPFFAAQGESA
ncbi:MAG: hypothetical protein BGO11_19450 [Solirubrobacterales bacterium 70-9]|nr:MAG: hypothetical protein BGO11_19450 [Solirubrobacterales bacterium 70-9]